MTNSYFGEEIEVRLNMRLFWKLGRELNRSPGIQLQRYWRLGRQLDRITA